MKHRYFYIINGERKEELRDGKWRKVTSGSARQSGNYIIRDQLGEGVRGVYNPATMKRYDSRSTYMRDTKAAGCEIVGNDQPVKAPPRARVRESIATTVERISQQKGWGL